MDWVLAPSLRLVRFTVFLSRPVATRQIRNGSSRQIRNGSFRSREHSWGEVSRQFSGMEVKQPGCPWRNVRRSVRLTALGPLILARPAGLEPATNSLEVAASLNHLKDRDLKNWDLKNWDLKDRLAIHPADWLLANGTGVFRQPLDTYPIRFNGPHPPEWKCALGAGRPPIPTKAQQARHQDRDGRGFGHRADRQKTTYLTARQN